MDTRCGVLQLLTRRLAYHVFQFSSVDAPELILQASGLRTPCCFALYMGNMVVDYPELHITDDTIVNASL
jgi:hypothetical protein